MDFLLASLPWQVIWGLQMKPIEKLGVGCAMSLGWLAGAAAIMRCINLSQLAQMDMSYDSMDEIVWTATEAGVTIIASSIPILRVYVQDKLALASARRHVPPASPSSTTPFSGMPHSPRPSRTGSVPLRPVSSRSSKRDGSTRFSLDQMVSGESDSEKRILPIKLNRRLR
ncbi:hypothetical protein F4780DRAFT_250137 [Xylariomycetidae sp. FL0641]|nr:hypothetical protein F4780DRAFT_250137 [Xylariomycetidae sp. FL0641]